MPLLRSFEFEYTAFCLLYNQHISIKLKALHVITMLIFEFMADGKICTFLYQPLRFSRKEQNRILALSEANGHFGFIKHLV